MARLRDFMTPPETEELTISKKPIVIPTHFQMPPENTPVGISRKINGVWGVRWFCIPRSGDRLKFRGYEWQVVRIEHGEVNVKGSPRQDWLPIVVTEYLGEAGQILTPP